MGKKIQVPAIGGIRKVIMPGGDTAVGTTIAELGSKTVTLAQLAQLLGVPTVTPGSGTGTIAPGGGAGVPASLNVGPGLSGGGPLVGAVPLNLIAPIPVFIMEDGGGGGDDGPPGVAGASITGAQGPMGPPIFLAANDGQDGQDAIPGGPGPIGPTGSIGATGPVVFFLADDGIEGPQGPPGPGGPLTISDGTNSVAGVNLLNVSGGVVSGSTPNAILTVSGGGGGGGTGVPQTIPNLCFWFEADKLSSGGTFYPVIFNQANISQSVYNGVSVLGTVSVSTTLNALNVATFNGSAQYILPGAGIPLINSTIFAVLNPASIAGNPSIFGGTQNNALELFINSSGDLSLVVQGVAIVAASTTPLSLSTWIQVNATYASTGGAWAFRQARTAINSGTAAHAVSAGAAGIACSSTGTGGAGSALTAQIAELIVYNRVLSGTEIANVEAYLLAKWGV